MDALGKPNPKFEKKIEQMKKNFIIFSIIDFIK